MVYHVNAKRTYSLFRNLPFGMEYWLTGTVNTAPSIKYNRSTRLTGWSSDGSATLVTVTPLNTGVVRVPNQFVKRCRVT